ncbi:Glycerol kinase [Neomoorella glycerini]|uniref:Glycerol kinase n=1 Tax=Neomoorella glycerini TaxID=55779 RepID=A0A6I5ZN70_9FIRM|nr:glycerol kinase GlpK [Moorella glycerini]QGP91055.1 Glycerol kinase [Moorella glycerini]
MRKFLLALDQGTTSSRAIVFDPDGRPVEKVSKEIRQIYPRPGWVEHDPEEIWSSQLEVARQAILAAGLEPGDIAVVGITNQRETVVIWDKETGRPLYNAIVWQCRRTAPLCEELRRSPLAGEIKGKTGLVIDAYFSATKIKWLLDNVPGIREGADRGRVLCGTIDSWLLWRLTGGQVHATDYSNASRTMLFNIHELKWEEDLLRELGIPATILPEVRPSCGYFGTTDRAIFGVPVPVTGMAGDQQAALFGQCCFTPGMVKNTYGTGCFILMNAGTEVPVSKRGLLSTIAWGIGNEVYYALEGSVFIAGAVVQWLRDELGLIASAAESEEYALRVEDTNGVFFVPAFVGLGAPYWDMYARGTICGLTRGANKYHLVRAALEAIAYQTKAVLDAMVSDTGIVLQGMRIDGGAAQNNFLMQFQADLIQIPVDRPKVNETTALGAAFLAGLGAGVYSGLEEIKNKWQVDRTFTPRMSLDKAAVLYRNWEKAVARAKDWA